LAAASWLFAQGPSHGRVATGQTSSAGKQSFLNNCSGCHGLDATGGDRAPGVAAGSNAAKMTDQELKRVIANGIAGAGMPPFASLGNAQVTQLANYLRTLQGKAGVARMPGDPRRGASLFFAQAKCSGCHMAAGQGGFLASDLTSYGESRTPDEIRRAILAPKETSENAVKEAVVRTSDGKEHKGIIRTEDNFSLVLQTMDGAFVLLHRSDVEKVSYSEVNIMPTNYGTVLSPGEINDLVSYLMGLRGKADPASSRATTRRGWEDLD
jgi:cytochrome c oxidase cbb3-type subunit III